MQHITVRNLLISAVLVGLVAGSIGVASALFTDSQVVDANAFTTGTLDISTNPTTALVTFTDMAPGDQVTAPITVSNGGSLELRYAITSTATNADSKVLNAQLELTIKTGVTACTDEGFGTDGTVIYGPADLGSVAGINLAGDPLAGANIGDRTLAAAANEVLCFNVSLPTTTGNAYQGATTTATFAFLAEQTTNNP